MSFPRSAPALVRLVEHFQRNGPSRVGNRGRTCVPVAEARRSCAARSLSNYRTPIRPARADTRRPRTLRLRGQGGRDLGVDSSPFPPPEGHCAIEAKSISKLNGCGFATPVQVMAVNASVETMPL